MSINSSSRITDDLRLDDTNVASVKAATDRTHPELNGPHAVKAAPRPPGSSPPQPRISPSDSQVDRQNSMAIHLHFSVDTGTALSPSSTCISSPARLASI